MRYLKKNEMFIDNFPTYNFRGFVYTPNTHGGKVYHTVVKDCRFVIDLSGPSNAVFSRKECEKSFATFTRTRSNASSERLRTRKTAR